MKKESLSLAVAGLTLSAHAAFAQFDPAPATTVANKREINVIIRTVCPSPTASNRVNYIPIAEAYPASSTNFARSGPDLVCAQPPNLPAGCFIFPNQVFCGINQHGEDNTQAAPGALCLQTAQQGGMTRIPVRLDPSCFALCSNSNFMNARVQSVRLKKRVPVSTKCPMRYGFNKTFQQFGPDIRTWWTLIYTAPGTEFELDVTTVCHDPITQRAEIHIDRYVWRVVVSLDSLEAVLRVLHSNTLSTSEIPCIADENVYQLLLMSLQDICDAVRDTDREARVRAQDALFGMEALILTFCSFSECFDMLDVFGSKDPPGNDLKWMEGMGYPGIIDTAENPCCCKLLVDLEFLAQDYGIVSPL